MISYGQLATNLDRTGDMVKEGGMESAGTLYQLGASDAKTKFKHGKQLCLLVEERVK